MLLQRILTYEADPISPARSVHYNFFVTDAVQFGGLVSIVAAITAIRSFKSEHRLNRGHLSADHTRIIFIILSKNESVRKDYLNFYCFFYVCVTCERYDNVKIAPSQVWDGEKRVLNLETFESVRVALLRKVTYVPVLTRESIYINVYGYRSHTPKHVLEILKDVNGRFSNVSIKLTNPEAAKNAAEAVNRSRERQFELLRNPELGYESPLTSGGSTYIPVSVSYLTFVTCDAIDDRAAARTYVRPFRTNIWITIGAAYFLTVAILSYKLGHKDVVGQVLLVGAVLLENARIPSSYLTSVKSQMLAGSCLLITVVLSNCYRGKITSDATASWEKSHYENFEQLNANNFQIYSPIPKRFMEYAVNNTAWGIARNFEGLRKYYDNDLNSSNYIFSKLGIFALNFREQLCGLKSANKTRCLNLSPETIQAHERLLRQLLSILRLQVIPTHDPVETITERVSECNRTALVDHNDEIGNFRPSMTWQTKSAGQAKFVKGKEKFNMQMSGWNFGMDSRGGGLASQFFRRLAIESGVFVWLKKGSETNSRGQGTLDYFWKQSAEARKAALGFTSGLISDLFIVYVACCAACFVAIVAEMIAGHVRWFRVKMWIRKFPSCF